MAAPPIMVEASYTHSQVGMSRVVQWNKPLVIEKKRFFETQGIKVTNPGCNRGVPTMALHGIVSARRINDVHDTSSVQIRACFFQRDGRIRENVCSRNETPVPGEKWGAMAHGSDSIQNPDLFRRHTCAGGSSNGWQSALLSQWPASLSKSAGTGCGGGWWARTTHQQ